METMTDDDGRTSVAEVFAIGDGARFGGAAGRAGTGRRWRPRPSPAISACRCPTRRRRGARCRRAGALPVGAVATVRGAAVRSRQAIDASAIVCRCEEVTAGDLRRLIADAGYDYAGGAEAHVPRSAWAAARAAIAPASWRA